MPDRPLLVIMLPSVLEAFNRRDLAEALLAGPGAVAVEPARVSRPALAPILAGMQARRMRLPGIPRAIVLFAPTEYPLAWALASRHPGCELWYGPEDGAAGELHEMALARATLRFDDSQDGRLTLAAAIERAGLHRG